MGDNKIVGSPLAQPHCPSGENRFAEVVDKIKVDNQLSKKEVSAIIACQYGAYLPPAIKPNDQPMSMKEMEKAGLIGGISKKLEIADDEVAIMFYRKYALGETDFNTPADPKITKELAVSHFKKLEAERIEHIQKRDLTETSMHFTDGRSITPEVQQSHEGIVKAISGSINPKVHGVTWIHDGSALVLKGPFYNGQTMIHEAMHQHSHQNVVDLPKGLLEGMTQYFTLNASKLSGNLHGHVSVIESPYVPETSAVYKLRGIVGEEVIRNTYFKGDIDGLKAAFESKAGEGSWKEYIEIWERNKEFGISDGVDLDLFLAKNPENLKSAFNSEAEFMDTLTGVILYDPIKGKVE